MVSNTPRKPVSHNYPRKLCCGAPCQVIPVVSQESLLGFNSFVSFLESLCLQTKPDTVQYIFFCYSSPFRKFLHMGIASGNSSSLCLLCTTYFKYGSYFCQNKNDLNLEWGQTQKCPRGSFLILVIGRKEIILVCSCFFTGRCLYTVCTIFNLLIIYQSHEFVKNLNWTLTPSFRDFPPGGENNVALFMPLNFLSLGNNF